MKFTGQFVVYIFLIFVSNLLKKNETKNFSLLSKTNKTKNIEDINKFDIIKCSPVFNSSKKKS